MERYGEVFERSRGIREEQYSQLREYISGLLDAAESKRTEYFQPDFTSVDRYESSLEKYRKDFLSIMGYPEFSENDRRYEDFKVREVFVGEDELCKIYRLFISVDEGLECYGLYLVPRDLKDKNPLMLCFHGAGGCPEMVCNLDNTSNYHDASRRFVKEGYIVFSPLFSFESFADEGKSDIPADSRMILDLGAKLAGTSLPALELMKVRRALDYLLTRREIDCERVHAAGLSYGGFYALLVSAADTRIKLCISSCFFNHRRKIYEKRSETYIDWLWKGSMEKFSDVELVELICPRSCIIEAGVHDELFPIEGARSESRRAAEIYQKLGIGDRFRYIEFEGTHEFNLAEVIRLLQENKL